MCVKLSCVFTKMIFLPFSVDYLHWIVSIIKGILLEEESFNLFDTIYVLGTSYKFNFLLQQSSITIVSFCRS